MTAATGCGRRWWVAGLLAGLLSVLPSPLCGGSGRVSLASEAPVPVTSVSVRPSAVGVPAVRARVVSATAATPIAAGAGFSGARATSTRAGGLSIRVAVGAGASLPVDMASSRPPTSASAPALPPATASFLRRLHGKPLPDMVGRSIEYSCECDTGSLTNAAGSAPGVDTAGIPDELDDIMALAARGARSRVGSASDPPSSRSMRARIAWRSSWNASVTRAATSLRLARRDRACRQRSMS
jgi:hypothetical protein